MARLLGLDWDHGCLRLVEATVHRGTVTLQRGLAWRESVAPNPAQAEEAGRRLREHLKEAGIAPAPVVACVGRDRVIVRDIRYPDVPPEEVPDIIRFQATKELTFPADETVIDYSLIGVPWPSGEKRALAAVLRKELLAAFETMCRVAGLRLEALTVRSFALLANWQAHAAAAGLRNSDPQALLVNDELCVARGDELLFSRSLAASNGNGQAATETLPEVRRSLAAFAGQFPKNPVRTLYVGDAKIQAGTEGLAAKLRLPVHTYEAAPAALLNGHADEAGSFAGAIGLVQAIGAGRRLPVDFLHPKQAPKASPNRNRRIALIAAGVAVPVLIVGIWYTLAVSARNAEIQTLLDRKAELKKQKDAYGDLEKRYDDISGWADGEAVQADELYDIFAGFPDVPGYRITSYDWSAYPVEKSAAKSPTTAKPTAAKTRKPIGVITLVIAADSSLSNQAAHDLLDRVRRALEEAKDHWILEPGAWQKDVPGPRQAQVTLKVLHVEPKDHKSVLSPPANKTSDNSPRGPGGRERGGPGGRFGVPGMPGGEGLQPRGIFRVPGQGGNP